MRTRLQSRTEKWGLSSQKLAPLEESGVFHRFACLTMVDVAVQVEVIVDYGVG